MNTLLSGVEKRHQDRYQQLVAEHSGAAHRTAAGPRLLPDESSTHAAAMAAWRFFHHPKITFSRLAEPLLQAAQDAAQRHCQDFALVPLDWSKLDFSNHASKTDRLTLGRPAEQGYKLLSTLLLSDRDGKPLAPLCQQLLTATGLLSSRFDRARRALSALDELAPVMDFITGLPLGKPPVFFIDAEADSVLHFRQWQKRGFLFLVRADGERIVRLNDVDGKELPLSAVAPFLQEKQAFSWVRDVNDHGRILGQYVAEQAVVLDRPAHLHRIVAGKAKRPTIPGVALPLRLIVAELRDAAGGVAGRWYLLTNVPAEVESSRIALWYYWRWTVESYFKLLKSAGQEVEHWQQEDGRSLLKRLLVASMACVLAWRLAVSEAPQAAEARRWVMRLSGRQVEHGKEYTAEGLLAGIWVLLAMTALLEELSGDQIKGWAKFVLGGSETPPSTAPPQQRAA